MNSSARPVVPRSLIVAFWGTGISLLASVVIMVMLYIVASSAAEVPMFISVIVLNLSAFVAFIAAALAAAQHSGPVRTHATVLLASIVIGRIILAIGGGRVETTGALATLQIISIVLLLGAMIYVGLGMKKGFATA
ncbi:hypothetical protein [Corynebacterium sp. TAE3-ERU30]|uniref:hypothetical protein n=1 Tax=Corynebacterium sp. TAE3-ERU30 TaxID=2849496 RepID=UPI001C45A0ED|nr:hypothetical protein [Corynebacterium sp. TAE3-ERU30]MBV7281873.1 hypothetical protein [Corynebacterium sp. TAE3-ERU30]